VDGEIICTKCLFGEVEPIEIYPIGYVKNSLKKGKGFGLKGSKHGTSEIHLFEGQIPFMHKIEDERYLTIVFLLHKPNEIKSKFRRGWDGKEVGIFSSRTPNRLNPIAITEVKLKKRVNNVLYVKGLDAIDGTPVLDIKMGYKNFL
jgi:tRNA-Thr(GGU) m(6)t(6)A37 methyltransferase TsaA